MEAEVMIGKYSVSFILTILLAWFFSLISNDPDQISNRVKKAVAVGAGVAMSILAMFYKAHTDSSVQIDIVPIVDYAISGFLIGAASIGINQLMKTEKTDVPPKLP
jgi:hypothetical protein